MAENVFTVYVPDRTQPFQYPGSMTHEEIRRALELNGYPSVATAEMVVENGNVIRFRRPTGGTKGI